MQINGALIQVERKGTAATLSMRTGTFRTLTAITLSELEALAKELAAQAMEWRRSMPIDCYVILEVSHTATEKEIKAAYRRLIKIHHPDLSDGDEGRTKLLNDAYEILGNSEKRRVYDATLTS